MQSKSSYELLGSDERALFQSLAVFTGGCTLPAIEAVWAARGSSPDHCVEGDIGVAPGAAALDREPVELLAALERKSLVRMEVQGNEPRFSMLETIREYASEQLSLSSRQEVVRGAHARYFLSMVRQADAAMHGPDAQSQRAYLSTELGNIREALRWAFSGGEAALGVQLAASLGRFWHLRGHWSEGRHWLGCALEVRGLTRRLELLCCTGQECWHTASATTKRRRHSLERLLT